MHGNEKVIEQLNAALASELTAIVQYMVQSETCQNWGYVRIGDFLKRRAIEEMGHAEGLIERIVFLDAAPKVDVALTPKIGANVQQQLEGDLKDEEDAVRQYNSAMNVCAEAGDNGSGDLFQTHAQGRRRARGLLGRSASFHQGNGHRHLPRAAVACRKIGLSGDFGKTAHAHHPNGRLASGDPTGWNPLDPIPQKVDRSLQSGYCEPDHGPIRRPTARLRYCYARRSKVRSDLPDASEGVYRR